MLIAIGLLIVVLLIVLLVRWMAPKQSPRSMTRLRREQIDRLIQDGRIED